MVLEFWAKTTLLEDLVEFATVTFDELDFVAFSEVVMNLVGKLIHLAVDLNTNELIVVIKDF